MFSRATYTATLDVQEVWKGSLPGKTLILKLTRREHDGVQMAFRPFEESHEFLIFARRQPPGQGFIGPDSGNAVYVPIDPEDGADDNGFESALPTDPTTPQVRSQKPLFLRVVRQIVSGIWTSHPQQYGPDPRKEALWSLPDFDWLYSDEAAPPDLPHGTSIAQLKIIMDRCLPKLFQLTENADDNTRFETMLTLAHLQQEQVIPILQDYVRSGSQNSQWLANNMGTVLSYFQKKSTRQNASSAKKAAVIAAIILGTETVTAHGQVVGPPPGNSPGALASKQLLPPSFPVRLRQALPYPDASMSRKMASILGVVFSSTRGFYLFTGADTAEARPRAQALRRSLKQFPHDAARYERLGEYEETLGEKGKAKQEYAQAAILYGRQVADQGISRAQQETALANQSRALDEAGHAPQAEVRLRRSLELRPRSWRLWDALAQVQEDEAQARTAEVTAGVAKRKQVAQALSLDQEAHRCFDRAVAVAPREAMPYADRGQFLGMDHPYLLDQVKRLQGVTAPPHYSVLYPAAIADLHEFVRLRPDDPYAAAYPAWLEVSTEGFFRLHLPFPSRAAWHAMSAATRHDALDALQQLARLSQSRNQALARRADVARGFLLFETQRDAAAAETALRQGLSGPDHQEAVEMLIHIMGMERQDQALATLCEAEARRHETLRLRLFAGRAEANQGHWPQARAQIERVLAQEPGDASDLLMLTAITLKEGRSPQDLAEAGALLAQAAAGLKHIPASAPPAAEQEEYRVTHAFYLALCGQLQTAQEELAAVLVSDPHDKGALKGLALLKQSQASKPSGLPEG